METIGQLRQDARQWKDQCLRLEETSRDWKEQFVRVEQERVGYLSRIEELMAERMIVRLSFQHHSATGAYLFYSITYRNH